MFIEENMDLLMVSKQDPDNAPHKTKLNIITIFVISNNVNNINTIGIIFIVILLILIINVIILE